MLGRRPSVAQMRSSGLLRDEGSFAAAKFALMQKLRNRPSPRAVREEHRVLVHPDHRAQKQDALAAAQLRLGNALLARPAHAEMRSRGLIMTDFEARQRALQRKLENRFSKAEIEHSHGIRLSRHLTIDTVADLHRKLSVRPPVDFLRAVGILPGGAHYAPSSLEPCFGLRPPRGPPPGVLRAGPAAAPAAAADHAAVQTGFAFTCESSASASAREKN